MRHAPDRAAPAAALALLLLAGLVAPLAEAGPWAPGPGDWTHMRRDAARAGASPSEGAFTFAPADLRVKWSRVLDPGPFIPPVAADLDGDGVAEVVAAVGNASADASNVQAPLSLVSGVDVLDGRTGAVRWRHGPTTGNLIFASPTLGDVDGDGKGDIVFLDSNPITGTFATSKVHAYSAGGQKLWEWSDSAWGQKAPMAINALAIGNLDGEAARPEVAAVVLLAVSTVSIDGETVVLTADEPETRLYALNGEGAGGVSWSRALANASAASPALGDLDGDGILDAVFGRGMKPGALLDGDDLRIELGDAFAAHTLHAFRGGTSARELWNVTLPGMYPGEVGHAPMVADLDLDGRPEVLQAVAEREAPRADVLAFEADGVERWRARVNASIIAPPAVADLDGDGKPEVVLQTGHGQAADRFRLLALAPDGSVLWRGPSMGRNLSGWPAVGDLTGDGRPEVATVGRNASNGQRDLLLFDGATGALQLRTRVDPGYALGAPLLVDLDGDDDGRLEVLVNVGEWGEPGRMLALEPELPELRVTDLRFSAETHAVGAPETVTATVRNLGSRAAVDAVVTWRDGDVVLHEAVVTLAPGASEELAADWTPAFGGWRTVRVAADPGKRIAEWSERDNEAAATVRVRAADLAFASGDPGLSDPRPSVGDTVRVNATLRNVGGKDADDVLVRFLDGGRAFAEVRVEHLAAGAEAAVAADLLVEGEGKRDVAVLADPDGAIPEEDEANNEAARLLDVQFQAPDLVLTAADLRPSDPNPDELDTLVVTATVRNEGSPGRDARDVRVQLLDRGAVAAETVLPLVPSGGAADATLAYVIEGLGKRDLEVRADPLGAVVELEEGNNAANLTVVVGKLDVQVTMTRPAYPLDERAEGSLEVRWRNTRRPAAGMELTLPVEHVVAVPPGASGPDAAALVAAALAQVEGSLANHLRVCVAGTVCLDTTVQGAVELVRVVGGGAGLGLGQVEVRSRLFTLEATTDARGQAAFDVPFGALASLEAARGLAMVRACPEGTEPVFALAGQPPPGCVAQAQPLPALPAVANLPGDHRATAVATWHGFVFAGSADYRHDATQAASAGVP